MTTNELAVILTLRMLHREPVWVNSPAGQRVYITMVSRDHEPSISRDIILAWDEDGNDRPVEDYLLEPPGAAS